MIITGKRKRTLDKRLNRLSAGTKLIPGVPINPDLENIVQSIGFTSSMEPGETVLPPRDFGLICEYNAEGRYLVHRDQPMETVYRQVEWSWKQWSGYWGTETKSKIVDVPYKRYPRTFVPPPSIELSINEKDENLWVVGPTFELSFDNPDDLIHAINIFLEIFGYCQILSDNLNEYTFTNIKRLNWRILPPGKYPWEKIEPEVKNIISEATPKNQVVIQYRLETIAKFSPEFVAVGTAGFHGYLIFGFPNRNLYILESAFYGNATYVFEEKWENLSRLSKAEVLAAKLQKDRIIHRQHWDDHINKHLK